MSEQVFLLTISLVLLAILLLFGIRAYSAVQQAKYRAAGNADTAHALASIDASLADLRQRIAAIEQILKQVD
ncbi:hypothetical protein [Pseudoduganella umbonata]|uniref:Type VI protein secretion system component VasK n=1 Tax=Pseudoduganella umbonata TaxID=864828 RepID=A0A4P8HVM2_9BURK|nr:hypothetical protein [Pseudoduganella umbonata]MBB3224674.1 type VI protein secretion system component VasK [Pseudoduganella umbonata]QCP13426.1 hypothetical protein FCL38_25555 [Pseudoduganella umbonata]